MKKVLVLFLLLLLVLIVFSGCVRVGDKMFGEDGRFEVIEIHGGSSGRRVEYILADTETSILYLFVTYGDRGGLTPLLDSKGEVQHVENYR